ncbi:hypothetical protein AWB77_06745 [Caballeronia fortuita]|uniref:Uncharacterized protein n=1 Tax=Caballeronia fortuita TaxID=1777138 RepID=A0A158E8Z7_9BURK|nr:hypothetical protein [Caballeronia fortuita]SAL03233.1 hypothetical protein AWB77_06745 [Caballeronia fortuita]
MQSTRDYLMELLRCGDSTAGDMADEQRMHRNTVDYHLKRAHKEGRAHIAGWKRHFEIKGKWAPVFRFGPGEDKPEPKRTKADKSKDSKRYYARNRLLVRARHNAKNGKPVNPYYQLMQH